MPTFAFLRGTIGNASGLNSKLISLGDLSDRTGLPMAWLKREADAGRLPCIRAGRWRMFDLDAVLKALCERREGGAATDAK